MGKDRHGSLADGVDAWRRARFRTITTNTWDRSWFPRLDPTATLASFTRTLSQGSEADKRASLERVIAMLESLRAAGREIVCIRLPVSAPLRALEDRFLPAQAFAAACRAHGFVFLDYWQEDVTTKDGSHLTGPSARRLSAQIAEDLAREFGR